MVLAGVVAVGIDAERCSDRMDRPAGRSAAGTVNECGRLTMEGDFNKGTVIEAAASLNLARFQSWLNGVSATTEVLVVVRCNIQRRTVTSRSVVGQSTPHL